MAAAGLPEPLLLSTVFHMDELTVGGQSVDFKYVFFTWVGMIILALVGLMVRSRVSLVPGRLQNFFEALVGGLEDFIVSNNLLPLGSLGYVLFCTRKNGWGWDGFMDETNAGEGIKFPAALRAYVTWFLPLLIAFIYLKGYYDMFSGKNTLTFVCWMIAAVVFLGFICWCAWKKPTAKKAV